MGAGWWARCSNRAEAAGAGAIRLEPDARNVVHDHVWSNTDGRKEQIPDPRAVGRQLTPVAQ